MSPTLLPVLQQHPFVAEFPPEHVDLLATLARQVHFDQDQVIFHQGDEYSVFYLLGEVRVALAFEGQQLLQTFKRHPEFGLAFMLRLMGVVSKRLRATQVQLLDMYSPVAKRAGT